LNKNIFLLWQGQLISQLGTQAFSIVMLFWLMENTGSSVLMSVVLIISTLPSILLGPISGVVADKVSRKKIIIVADIIRGISVLTLATFFIYGVAEEAVIILLFAITALINGICKAFFQPAIDAWIPDLVSTKNLPRTIAIFSSSTQVSTIIGQALGGILYKVLGAPILLLLDALSYLFSAISECFIQTEQNTQSNKRLNIGANITCYKSDLTEGFVYVQTKQGLFQTMLFTSSINFFIAPLMLLLPFYVTHQLSSQAHWYGFLLAGMASGSLLGFWLSATIKPVGNSRAITMFSSMLLLSTCLFLLSQSHSNYISLMSIVIVGFCIGVFNLQTIILFQTCTPSNIRGRVMSLLMTISSGLLPLGLLIGGALGSLTDNDTQLIFSLSALSIAILTVFFACNTNVRKFLFSQLQHSSRNA
jgi:DHA3 family macrolide efflux protein-like MFS transporter